MSFQTHVEKNNLSMTEIMDVTHLEDLNRKGEDFIEVKIDKNRNVVWVNIGGMCVFRAKSDVKIVIEE